jgi:sugar lactone lactonase YvrE
MPAVECILKMRSILGEGPLWDERQATLYWLDLRKPAIYRFDPATGRNGRVKADLRGFVGAMVLRDRGGMMVLDHRGIFHLDPVSGRMKPFAKPAKNMRSIWFNDAKCDHQGNLWAGMGDRKEQKPLGVFYRIAPTGKAAKVDSKFICPNGPAFSPDGRTCYFADTNAGKIYRYDIDPGSGKIGPRRLFAALSEGQGMPDGMTVDSEGGIWSCHWDGWRITRYSPDGRVDRAIDMPVPRPTSVAFGGADLSTLYITSASLDLTREQIKQAPLSGSLFACQPGVRGLVEPRFAG